MKRPRSPRAAFQFGSSLHHNLNAYALGAAAAGVTALAATPPAAAEVIFTPAHEKVTLNGRLNLDLNHDGIVDFLFANFYGSTTGVGDRLYLEPINSFNGAVQGIPNVRAFPAAALPAGVVVGPHETFGFGSQQMAYASRSADSIGGSWKRAKNRFLGLRFQINGHIHFGWARLTVGADAGKDIVAATLTGYAYETVAGRPIVTGQTQGTFEDTSSTPSEDQPSSTNLGQLALGSRGLTPKREGSEMKMPGLS
jgi:hypothetical protein